MNYAEGREAVVADQLGRLRDEPGYVPTNLRYALQAVYDAAYEAGCDALAKGGPGASPDAPPARATASAQVEQDGQRVQVICSGPPSNHERLAEAAVAALRAAVSQLNPPF